MKTLIIIRERDHAWLRNVFPDIHPLLFPICNKPFIEFLIDFSILAGSEAVRIVSDGSLIDVEEYCDHGSLWGTDISYSSIMSMDDQRAVIEKNRRFCSEEKILIISGLVFIQYDKLHDYKSLFASQPNGDILVCNEGSLSLTGNPPGLQKNSAPFSLSLIALDSLDGYYRLCMEILGFASSPYVLPGYNNEAYCHIGRNVVISKSAEIRKPVMIGNNVQILEDAIIGPGAVIGSNVIIDRKSTVTESIVLANTYIGEQLEVQNKIAAGNMLIEPEGGICITMDDPHLLTGIKKSGSVGSLLQFLVHSFAALLLITLQLIPFLILSPILTIQGKWKKSKNIYYTGTVGETLTLTTTTIERRGFISSLAAALSLDRFALLFSVLRGHLAVIGSSLELASDSNTTLHAVESWYHAGVFSYAEAEEWPVSGGDKAIVERYFAVHGNPFLDITMTIKAFFNRIHETNTP